MSDAAKGSEEVQIREFVDARGVRWTTGVDESGDGARHRWFRAAGRRERRYDVRNGESEDESLASLRAQLHACIAWKSNC